MQQQKQAWAMWFSVYIWIVIIFIIYAVALWRANGEVINNYSIKTDMNQDRVGQTGYYNRHKPGQCWANQDFSHPSYNHYKMWQVKGWDRPRISPDPEDECHIQRVLRKRSKSLKKKVFPTTWAYSELSLFWIKKKAYVACKELNYILSDVIS